MRVSLATSAVVVATLLSVAGCSSTPTSGQPFWERMGFKSKSSTPANSALTSAPPAPLFNPAAPAAPAVTMPPAAQTASNLPLYPGTNYPVTPYQPATVPTAVVTTPVSYPLGPPATSPGQPAGVTPPAAAYNAANPTGTYAR